MKREKKVVAPITEEAFQAAQSAYASADAQMQQINAIMDRKITEIRERWADPMRQLQKQKEEAFDTVQTYCNENKSILFDRKRSLETIHGVIGFRTGTHKLKVLKGYKWEDVLPLVEEQLPDYVRTEKEVDKKRLIADRNNEEVAAALEGVGLTIVQDETFFIELKKEEPELV